MPLESITEPKAVERRLWRNVIIIVVVAILMSAARWSLRFTLGVTLGGLLALFNYRWLHSSLKGILAAGNIKAPRGTIAKFILRWVVVGAVGYACYLTGYVDAVGIIVGMLAPAAAAMIEAGYLAIRSISKG